jgi:hypothetical protein
MDLIINVDPNSTGLLNWQLDKDGEHYLSSEYIFNTDTEAIDNAKLFK